VRGLQPLDHLPASAASYVGIMRWFARRGFPEQDAVWIILEAMSDEPAQIDNAVLDRARKEIEACQRDEHDVLKVAASDLVRLDRYECRASSRQKRAIQEFMMIKAKVRSARRVPAADKDTVCETQVLAG
jgi:hypothetical protein